MSISKLILACGFALGSLCLSPASHAAAPDASAKAEAKKPAAKKKAVKKAAAGAAAAGAAAAIAATPENAEEANEPGIEGTSVTEFDCELGNKITIYRNASDDNYIALRWKKRLHRLTRVGTTTGANRFENKLYGLIWIGIPAKGMLLDSKLNRQLANECRSPEQLQPAAAPVPAAQG
ncbi:hypothetical protein [Pseudoduganella namucuonensis]|uniref:Exported signal peptide protein n=1 Tax=Pseudoduganella namucuonensis TaxID=1035707 RepID=A0A1I7IZD7_9BURK|nr:hypothetical protein [Pseudoduganella namucuonensis]SFU78325.1 hypothetical protein SAMN05216552_1009188 [Pseudoduganella namucuonensis]